MPNCVMCGSSIPDNQGSKTCSMCYGDIDHGRDGYYRQYMEEMEQREQMKRQEQRKQEREQEREQEQEQDEN